MILALIDRSYKEELTEQQTSIEPGSTIKMALDQQVVNIGQVCIYYRMHIDEHDGCHKWSRTTYPSRALEFIPSFQWGSCYLVSCLCFVDPSLSFGLFSFSHCAVCPSSIDPFGIFKLFLNERMFLNLFILFNTIASLSYM